MAATKERANGSREGGKQGEKYKENIVGRQMTVARRKDSRPMFLTFSYYTKATIPFSKISLWYIFVGGFGRRRLRNVSEKPTGGGSQNLERRNVDIKKDKLLIILFLNFFYLFFRNYLNT